MPYALKQADIVPLKTCCDCGRFKVCKGKVWCELKQHTYNDSDKIRVLKWITNSSLPTRIAYHPKLREFLSICEFFDDMDEIKADQTSPNFGLELLKK